MAFKPSILSASAGLFLAVIIVYSIFNYGQLTEGEGWGVVAMIGLLGIGLALLAVDVLLQMLLKNRTTINIIGVIVIAIATFFFVLK